MATVQYVNMPFSTRYFTLGDTAEGEFEARAKKGYVRTGLKRPPVRVSDLHPYVRQMPDYLTSRGWVEVMGVGDDQTLKLKLDKLEALVFWRMLMPLTLWVWDSRRDRHAEAPLERINELTIGANVDRFPEGQFYYQIPAKELFEGV